jgi:hypothetical protein
MVSRVLETKEAHVMTLEEFAAKAGYKELPRDVSGPERTRLMEIHSAYERYLQTIRDRRMLAEFKENAQQKRRKPEWVFNVHRASSPSGE